MAEKIGSTSGGTKAYSADKPPAKPTIVDEITTRSEASGSGTADNNAPRRRPIQVKGVYPVRNIIWYQVSTSDIRNIGVAQFVTTVCAAVGTYAMSIYIEFNKDLSIAEASSQIVPSFLESMTNIAFVTWVVFWVIGIIAFWWQGSEWHRIKSEHQQ